MFCSSLKNGTQVDINETDEYGFTALHMASENGHLKVIARNSGGLIIFTNIVYQVVEELLAAGAKLDPLVFDSYLLPLHMAINKVPCPCLTASSYLLQEQRHTCTGHICAKLTRSA